MGVPAEGTQKTNEIRPFGPEQNGNRPKLPTWLMSHGYAALFCEFFGIGLAVLDPVRD